MDWATSSNNSSWSFIMIDGSWYVQYWEVQNERIIVTYLALPPIPEVTK